eukprot:CCRYP_021133-RA/>CCRYP_021133-RA protein AED:0.45 eAED:0.45 QI:0/0/0/1/0/0/2/0/104
MHPISQRPKPAVRQAAISSSPKTTRTWCPYINARSHTHPHLLTELGHTQPPTPIQIDNSTALGAITNTIQPKRTKAMDMRFHWLRCRTNQNSSDILAGGSNKPS